MLGLFRQNTSAFFIFSLVFSFVYIIPTKLISTERYLLDIFFYVTVALLLIYTFKVTYKRIISETHWYEFLALISISLLVHGLVSYFILSYVEQPTWPFSDKGASFLLLDNFYIWAKPFDVLVQQLTIVLLISKLRENDLTLKQIISFFIIIFGATHIFQALKTDFIIGLVFTLGAITSSLIYPYLLLHVRNGYIFNYMIHLGIYNLAALAAWLLY